MNLASEKRINATPSLSLQQEMLWASKQHRQLERFCGTSDESNNICKKVV